MTTPSATYRSVFGVGEFTRLWLAHLLSVAGDQLARVALTVLVFQRTDSAGLSALTYALTYLPDLIGGATLGGLADRYPRRAVMVTADVARACLVAIMAIPVLPLGGQVALLAVVQLLAAPFSAARQAALPDILDGDRLTVGLGIIQTTYQAGLVIGFGAGAAVVTALGVPNALLVDAATFAISALLIRFGLSRHRPRSVAQAASPGRWATITAGWRLVARDPRLRALLTIACCSGFYVVPEGLAVPYAAQLGSGTGSVGWLLAANPVGSVIGMLLLKRMAPGRRLRLLGPLAVASSLILIPTGWLPGLWPTVVLWVISGAFSAHDMITQSAYVATAPADQRGKAVGVAIAALRAAQGIAIILAGVLAQWLHPSTVITGAAALGVLVAGIAALRWARATSSPPPLPQRDEADEG